MTTSSIDTIHANLERAAELRSEYRAIWEAANSANREPTKAEDARSLELYNELQDLDRRTITMTEQAQRGAAIGDALGAFAPFELTGTTAPTGARSVGGITPIRFTDNAMAELHAAYNEHRSLTVEAEDFRAVTAVPMATAAVPRFAVAAKRREPVRIAELLQSEPTSARTVTFYQASAGADAAAPVAEGAAKPESSPGWVGVDAPVRKLAHYVDVSTEALADFADFEQVVRQELLSGLLGTENAQVLSGSGTGENIKGLLNATGIQTLAPASIEDPYRTITHALTMLRTGAAFTEGDTVLLSPNDYEGLQLALDGGGRLMFGAGGAAEALGWPTVIPTTGLTDGTVLVGNLADAAVVFQREVPSIMVDPYSQSKNNLVRFVCEERLAIGAIRPAAMVKVTLKTS